MFINQTSVASSLLNNFAVNQFGNKTTQRGYAIDNGATFCLHRTPRGGYFTYMALNDKIYRTYTHPCRSLRIQRLAYDIDKLARSHSGYTNVSNVKEVPSWLLQ